MVGFTSGLTSAKLALVQLRRLLFPMVGLWALGFESEPGASSTCRESSSFRNYTKARLTVKVEDFIGIISAVVIAGGICHGHASIVGGWQRRRGNC